MTRAEWIFVTLLSALTLVVLVSVPPISQQALAEARGQVLAQAQVEVATPAPRTATSSPSPTPEPTFTATVSSPTRAAATSTPRPTATPTSTVPPTATASPSITPFPFDTRADLDRFIYIDQAVQRMFVFEKGRLLRNIACSTGAPQPDKYTPAWNGQVGYYHGTFFSFDVYADDAWYLFQHDGAILIHSLPYTVEDGVKVYQDREFLGVRPVSHGCIRISPENAKWLTEWNPEGVTIVITDPYLEKWQ